MRISTRWLALVVALPLWVLALDVLARGAEADHHHEQPHAHHHDWHEHHQEDDHGTVQHGAHVHGEVRAFVVLEGQLLNIALESPAMNIVGFEHRVRTDEQRLSVLAAQDTLERVKPVLQVHGGDCQLQSAEVDISQLYSGETHSQTGHQHAQTQEGHEDKGRAKHAHRHAQEDKHDHKHKDDKASQRAHADIIVNFAFSCAQPQRLSGVEFTAFDAFSGIEKIAAQWINDGGQGAAHLTARDPMLRMQ